MFSCCGYILKNGQEVTQRTGFPVVCMVQWLNSQNVEPEAWVLIQTPLSIISGIWGKLVCLCEGDRSFSLPSSFFGLEL